MNKSRKLATLFTMTAAVVMLSGTSAFAESRHRAETRRDRQATEQSQQQNATDPTQSARTWTRERGTDRTQAQNPNANNSQRFDRSRAYNRVETYNQPRVETQQFNTRSESNRSYNRDNQSYRDHESYRNNNQSYRGGSYSYHAPASHESRYYSGRVQRIEHSNGGFRVWIGGAPYPFFISSAYWRHFPLHVGLNIRLGGYWDPLGYYNAYSVAPWSYSSAGDLRGVVENVDYGRGLVVIHDDISNSFVTVALRGNDPRLGSMRPGDYVDLSGGWNRGGVFDAYTVRDLRPGSGYAYGPNGPGDYGPAPY